MFENWLVTVVPGVEVVPGVRNGVANVCVNAGLGSPDVVSNIDACADPVNSNVPISTTFNCIPNVLMNTWRTIPPWRSQRAFAFSLLKDSGHATVAPPGFKH